MVVLLDILCKARADNRMVKYGLFVMLAGLATSKIMQPNFCST